jgi:multisubunit Na+/H+ antiporter MnhC subunit
MNDAVLGTLVIGFSVVVFLLYCAVEELREIHSVIQELRNKPANGD